eukprot:CAMPEP_0117420304 /NCGR_PEP_ID=MMETSP0758-20121206/1666_1 /TAXON_ID=63605 /ORGANISM="Percolomonas cosmopolitus, Strain AE-1 (ATCC 50343)" /LENGTH=377 /DNA_ID=CAMNT_0005201835 /DNA_START=1544 /DNA_END=2677 /DNA_ORIENTATION=+
MSLLMVTKDHEIGILQVEHTAREDSKVEFQVNSIYRIKTIAPCQHLVCFDEQGASILCFIDRQRQDIHVLFRCQHRITQIIVNSNNSEEQKFVVLVTTQNGKVYAVDAHIRSTTLFQGEQLHLDKQVSLIPYRMAQQPIVDMHAYEDSQYIIHFENALALFQMHEQGEHMVDGEDDSEYEFKLLHHVHIDNLAPKWLQFKKNHLVCCNQRGDLFHLQIISHEFHVIGHSMMEHREDSIVDLSSICLQDDHFVVASHTDHIQVYPLQMEKSTIPYTIQPAYRYALHDLVIDSIRQSSSEILLSTITGSLLKLMINPSPLHDQLLLLQHALYEHVLLDEPKDILDYTCLKSLFHMSPLTQRSLLEPLSLTMNDIRELFD